MDPAAKEKLEAYWLEWYKATEEYRLYQKRIHFRIQGEAVLMTYDLYEGLNQSGDTFYTKNGEKIEEHKREISKYLLQLEIEMRKLQDKSENFMDSMKKFLDATLQQNQGVVTESQGSEISDNEGQSGNAKPTMIETEMDIDWDSLFPSRRVGEPQPWWPDAPTYYFPGGGSFNQKLRKL